MKKQMNIFIPYHEINENSLTRGFLLLLKYSPSVFYMFYDYIKEKFELIKSELNIEEKFESIYSSCLNYEITTQIGCEKAKNLLNPKILSILITDENLEIDDKIGCSNRTAIYDGVIELNNEWTFIIENKPNNKNVWTEQLCVGEILGNEIKNKEYSLIKAPVILTWREIFKRLDYVNVSRFEKQLIADFKDFVFIKYPKLFPYETFKQCRLNKQLLDLKIEKLLTSIIKNNYQDKIGYNSGWAYSIALNGEFIQQIDYRPEPENNSITTYFFYGLKIPQSRNFFSEIKTSKVDELDSNFNMNLYIRIASMWGGEIYSIFCIKGYEKEFINYWKNNIDKIGEYNINDFDNFVQNELKNLKFIEIDYEDLKDNLGNRKKIRISPVFLITYCLPFEKIYDLESRNMIKQKFIEISKNGLAIVNQDNYFNELIV